MKKLVLICGVMALSACATQNVAMLVTHPSEVNMNGYQNVAIGQIKGSATAGTFSDGIRAAMLGTRVPRPHRNRGLDSVKNMFASEGTSALADDSSAVSEKPQFKVIDRENLNQILKEQHLGNSDLADPEQAAKLGKLMIGTALLTGKYDATYRETVERTAAKCQDDKGNQYNCTNSHRVGVVITKGSVDVIDTTTGRIVLSKPVGGQCGDDSSATNGDPAPINRENLLAECIDKDVTTFARAVLPWKETVQAPFKKDGDIPQLEAAINQLKIGEVDKAIKMLTDAIKASENNPSIKGKTIALAYWDLGLVYQYTRQFDKAILNFKQAYSRNADDEYIKAMNRCKVLQAEAEKMALQQKGASLDLTILIDAARAS